MNQEKLQPSQEAPEGGQEKEKFEPQIIFDFIRHGQAEYGELLKQKVQELGYEWKNILPTSRTTNEEIESPADLEGRVTAEGKKQLEEAVKILVEKIDKDQENIMVLFGPRFRTVDSSKTVLEELEQGGVDVRKAREHKDLIDMKKHWLAILEFVKTKAPEAEKVFHYWLNMSEQEIHEADLESLEDIGRRMDHFVQLIKRYARMYKNQLGLENKKLRVIAVTHDTNIMSALKKEGVPPGEMGIIKNAQIVELGVNKEGESKLIL
jgi:broad specificity phosphatase PhoE